MIDILAIGAHPDDVELGAGGTLALQKSLGHTFAICDLTAGELGTRGSAELRAKEAAAAADILGATARVNLGLKDGFFSENEESLKALVAVIRHFKPKYVFANALRDRHPDHGEGSNFASKACFLSGLRKIETTYYGQKQEAHRPDTVYHYVQDRWIQPDVVFDITNFFEQKMKAVLAFQSQFYQPGDLEPKTPISSEDYLKFLEGRAREMGRMIGRTFGEGFTSERPIGAINIQNLL